MKKSFILFILGFVCMTGSAQNSLKSSDDEARIAISPYIDPNLGFNSQVQKQLLNKMDKSLTEQGIAGYGNQRFIITANADILSENIIVAAKEMYQYTLDIHFAIGDGIEGTKFAMASQTVKGVGESKADAYIHALRQIKTDNNDFKVMVDNAKNKILEYYNSKCDFIIAEATALSKKQDYDGAIYKLMSVPDVCKDCYEKCMTAVSPIYQAKIDEDGARYLAEAQGIWAASQDREAAERAGNILANINPSSSSFALAEKLNKEIAARIKEIDNREWKELTRQQKEYIKTIRDIGVEYGKHQQQTTYNIGGWW